MIYGPPLVGVGVGFIGGIHRFYMGGPTAVPCTLATILSGVFAGAIYYFSKGKFVYIAVAVIFAAAIVQIGCYLVEWRGCVNLLT